MPCWGFRCTSPALDIKKRGFLGLLSSWIVVARQHIGGWWGWTNLFPFQMISNQEADFTNLEIEQIKKRKLKLRDEKKRKTALVMASAGLQDESGLPQAPPSQLCSRYEWLAESTGWSYPRRASSMDYLLNALGPLAWNHAEKPRRRDEL